MSRRFDVLVVGAGPAGASAAYWLARHGHDVCIVERHDLPRDKTCGDALTPRAVAALVEMGLGGVLDGHHRTQGIRMLAHGITLELDWPTHPRFPPYGHVVRRLELDRLVAENAVLAGATLLTRADARTPLVERGFVRGAEVAREGRSALEAVRARYVVVADGANSRFGRSLGTFRTKEWPYGTAIRGYWPSPLDGDTWLETQLDVKDRDGNPLPGYGWIFPVGDGTVNVGVGLLSTYRNFKSVNPLGMLHDVAAGAPAYWELDPGAVLGEPASGRLPMGGSVDPKAGPTYLLVGDAAGTVNPFNGAGIDYACETGRLAADVLHEALDGDDPMVLQTYPHRLDDIYGPYFKVGRIFARAIGHPSLMRQLTRVAIHNRTVMDWMVRLMANLLRPDERGAAERAFRVAAAIARVAPEA
jgi:menaquinone-9 beta-reductase